MAPAWEGSSDAGSIPAASTIQLWKIFGEDFLSLMVNQFFFESKKGRFIYRNASLLCFLIKRFIQSNLHPQNTKRQIKTWARAKKQT